jgi:hypothetical protein
MYLQSISVPGAIKEVLASNHVYLQALESGIANYTALAEKIKPDIEQFIGSKVNLNTIVVAIKRFADAMEQKRQSNHSIQPSNTGKARMSLTGSIIDIDFQKERSDDDDDDDDDDTLENIFEEFFEQENRYDLFQTDSHFTLLTEDVENVRRIVADAIEKFDGKIKGGLSKITIFLGPDEQSPNYLLSLVSNILYNLQIPVHSAFFTPLEIVLILSDKDAARAYDLIRMKIG